VAQKMANFAVSSMYNGCKMIECSVQPTQ